MSKRYSPSTTKKAIDTYNDPYLPKGGIHDMAICRKCHAIYHNKRWYMDKALYKRRRNDKASLRVLCPACRKIKDNYAEGFVMLSGKYLMEHKQDILNLVKNEEEKAMAKNPLERIINLDEKDRSVEITTTHERLAQRIGKKIHKACQGELQIKWTKDKLTRVTWRR